MSRIFHGRKTVNRIFRGISTFMTASISLTTLGICLQQFSWRVHSSSHAFSSTVASRSISVRVCVALRKRCHRLGPRLDLLPFQVHLDQPRDLRSAMARHPLQIPTHQLAGPLRFQISVSLLPQGPVHPAVHLLAGWQKRLALRAARSCDACSQWPVRRCLPALLNIPPLKKNRAREVRPRTASMPAHLA